MAKKFLKTVELKFKHGFKAVLLLLLPRRPKPAPELAAVRKVLVFRLDQRIGNGILLLPLLGAIRASGSRIELHFLIHYPVAELMARAAPGNLLTRIWPYHQRALLRRPWRYLSLLRNLRRENFDVVITSHNPDNFSLSQALFGRWIRPRWLVGFDARDSRAFYDVAVKSSTEKHYGDAMIDLWRVVDPAAQFRIGGLKLPAEQVEEMKQREGAGGVLLWLGATGSKVLPAAVITFLYQQSVASACPVQLAAGPADAAYLQTLPAEIRDRTRLWHAPLTETAAFFAGFDVFFSGDTGPMHLAAALDIPTLTIFVNSNLRQYGYHDGQRHFSLLWRDTPEDREKLRWYLQRLLPIRGERKGEDA